MKLTPDQWSKLRALSSANDDRVECEFVDAIVGRVRSHELPREIVGAARVMRASSKWYSVSKMHGSIVRGRVSRSDGSASDCSSAFGEFTAR